MRLPVISQLLWIALVVTLFPDQPVLCVKFADNGYEFLVAIHRDVPEDVSVIEELQNMLTSASEYLYLTTRKYLFIRHVTILVPETWTRNPDWRLENDISFSEADIRVDSPHPVQENTPYTFQPGQCGEPGRYIHLTPDFVTDRGINRDFNYGDAGRVIVHEFAHLRFGVFDEYGNRGSSDHPPYYIDDEGDTLRPTACSHEIDGSFVDIVNDLSCESGDIKKPLSDNCDFLVNQFSNKATASVMYAQFLEEVTQFCENDPEDSKLKHNADAPNLQNKMCMGKGTWDVIREHPDVKESGQDVIGNRRPNFQIAYRQVTKNGTRVCGHRLVLVLDVSKSMINNNSLRYYKLRQMADKTIRDILPQGTEVGIVIFSTQAAIRSNMVRLSSPADRATLAQGLPEYGDFDGATAIGQGLMKAIELLKKNGASAKKGRLFLITDGKELLQPFVKDVISNITSENVVVHTLAYSDSAATVLQQLSTLTGGQYSFYDEASTSSVLDGAAERLLSDISLCQKDDTIEIDRRAVLLTLTASTFEKTVLIDSSVGNNTLFVFTLTKDATTEITLEDPSGNVLGSDSTYYSKDKSLNIVRFLIPLAQVGRWKYKLKRGSNLQGGESVVAVVRSHQRGATRPYQVEAWISSSTFDYSGRRGVVAYTRVHQGYAPILRARVDITVTRAGESPFDLVLKDDGKLPDNTANDGVYSNFLLGFKSNSRYSLEVTVESVAGETVIIEVGNLLSGRTLTIYQNTSRQEVHKVLEGFTRTTSAGAIDIAGYNSTLDQLDPGRVTDLDLAILDKVKRSLTVTWTAPGDDFNMGTVTRYDLRLAKTFASLRTQFTAGRRVENEDVLNGSLVPLLAGSQQTVVIQLPDNWSHDFVVAGLKAFDEGNRVSDLSNLKSITFNYIFIPQRPVETKSGPNGSVEPIVWIGIAIGGTLLIALIVTVVILYFCRKREKTNKVV